MKILTAIICCCVVVGYLILPTDGYSWEDVNNKTYNATVASSSGSFSSDKFIEDIEKKEEAEEAKKENPTIDYIVHPNTSYNRTGTVKENTYIGITAVEHYSGWRGHHALDTSIGGEASIGSCISGNTSCYDTVLISPVTGIVSEVTNNGHDYVSHFEDHSNNTRVAIDGTGAFEGYTFYILHLSSIPQDLKVGDVIHQGDYIGCQCSQGNSYGDHVHFNVYQGGARVPVSMWFNKLALHSSITEITSLKGTLTVDYDGIDQSNLDIVNSNPRYDSVVEIPDEYKITS